MDESCESLTEAGSTGGEPKPEAAALSSTMDDCGPSEPLMLALYQPDIPQNAGTLLRTCACLGVAAAIIEPAGFSTSDRHFRRAGMDYLERLALARHTSFARFEAWRRAVGPRRLILLSTAGACDYRDVDFRPGDIVMVGRESAGVPLEVHHAADLRIKIAMREGFRSLNVAVAGAMVLGEALRQIGLRRRDPAWPETT